MTTPTHPVAVPRSLLTRLLQMILLAIAFQIAITVLGAVALVQLVLAAWAATWHRLPALKPSPAKSCPSRLRNGRRGTERPG